MTVRAPWRVLCSHGLVLLYVAQHPGCSADEIATALVVTPRTVWTIVGDLKRAGFLGVTRAGKRHYYHAEPLARLTDPPVSHLTLQDVVRLLAAPPAARAEAAV